MTRLAAAILVLPAAVLGQSFEVASIRLNLSGDGRSSVQMTPGQVVMENVSLRKCIALAYNLSEDRDYAISGPDWLGGKAYNLAAKYTPGTPPDQVRAMLQNLLAERFQLKLHRESKASPIYALVTARNGAKLRESAEGTAAQFNMSAGHIAARAASMAALADRLSGAPFAIGRPVVDATGLAGAYDFILEWAAEGEQDSTRPSLFTAVEEQLGLKLEPRRAPVQVLVVDSALRKPTEN